MAAGQHHLRAHAAGAAGLGCRARPRARIGQAAAAHARGGRPWLLASAINERTLPASLMSTLHRLLCPSLNSNYQSRWL